MNEKMEEGQLDRGLTQESHLQAIHNKLKTQADNLREANRLLRMSLERAYGPKVEKFPETGKEMNSLGLVQDMEYQIDCIDEQINRLLEDINKVAELV